VNSHTVPRKLLDQFAYDDPVTRSRRLWRYEKNKPPYGFASPKTATRFDGHFLDPRNPAIGLTSTATCRILVRVIPRKRWLF